MEKHIIGEKGIEETVFKKYDLKNLIINKTMMKLYLTIWSNDIRLISMRGLILLDQRRSLW